MANEKRKETPRVVKNLKIFTEKYVKDYKIQPVNPESFSDAFPDGNKARTYYNNLEIVHMKFFQRPEVKKFTNAVLDSQGIYKYR